MEYGKESFELEQKYEKRMQRKMQGKPMPVQIIMSRTFSSALMIVESISHVPFEQLSLNIYKLCKDVQFQEIVKAFDAELELAGANEEKFIFHLHKFYNDISSRIRKENKYHEYAEYIGTIVRLRNEKVNEINQNVSNAYLSMVLQTLEYMRKEKFNLDTCAYGVSTDGELLMGKYPYPYSDLPALELKHIMQNDKGAKSKEKYFQIMIELYKKYGMEVNSLNDLDILAQAQKIHALTTTALFPFINEFTYDIVPIENYNSNVPPLSKVFHFDTEDVEHLKKQLQHRNKTLQSNGVLFEIDDTRKELQSALLKEVLYHDSVYMLYRLDTMQGSLSGYYDTQDGFLFSIAQDANVEHSYINVAFLVLSMYASQVINNATLDSLEESMLQAGQPIKIRAYGKGDKLQDTYHPSKKHSTRNLNNYDTEERYINVIIRNLPEGKKASKEAQELAAQYGYELEEGQTFVRPYIKQVFVKKS